MNNRRKKKLVRSRSDRYIGGVIGGFANYFGWDSTWARVITALLFIIPPFTTILLVYIVLWIVIPLEPKNRQSKPNAENVDTTDPKDQEWDY